MRLQVLLLSLAIAACAAPTLAQTADLGPKAGSQAPSIVEALDETGQSHTVEQLSGPKGLVLMFFRSAQWCPYCQGQLLDMNGGVAEIEKRGYRVAALSYDSPKIQAAFKAQRQIAFTFLSDSKSVVIDRFGLRDPLYRAGSFAYGVPRPIIFILDPKGGIEAKLYEETYKKRPPVGAVIARIDALEAAR